MTINIYKLYIKLPSILHIKQKLPKLPPLHPSQMLCLKGVDATAFPRVSKELLGSCLVINPLPGAWPLASVRADPLHEGGLQPALWDTHQ